MPATQVSKSQCIELQSNPGYYLLKDAAYAWDRSVAAFGKLVLITGAWRSYETQLAIFLDRYRRGNHAGEQGFTNDVRWWPADGNYWTRREGEAAAAVPGQSNHGGGLAVDVKTARQAGDPPYAEAVIFGSWSDVDRTRFLRIAAEHGWDDDEGRIVSELWHLTYYPERDRHRGQKPPTLQEEPDMDTTQAEQLSETRALAGETRTLVDQIKQLLGGRVDDIGTEAGLTHGTALERLLILGRRDEARDLAEEAAPAAVDVDATEVADALLVRLSPSIAKDVADALAARLAK